MVTTHRLVLVEGLVTRSEQALPLNRIQDIRTRLSPFSGGDVVVSTAGGSLGVQAIRFLRRADAAALAEALTALGVAAASGGHSGL